MVSAGESRYGHWPAEKSEQCGQASAGVRAVEERIVQEVSFPQVQVVQET